METEVGKTVLKGEDRRWTERPPGANLPHKDPWRWERMWTRERGKAQNIQEIILIDGFSLLAHQSFYQAC